MKKFFILTSLAIMLSSSGMAQQIKANFSYSTFSSPTNEPYIETYLHFNGNSLKYKPNSNNKWQATVEVTYIFKQGDKIVDFKKQNVQSPESEDSSATKINFYNQQRIPLTNGKYDFEIVLKDLNSPDKEFLTSQELDIDYKGTAIELSDITLIESFKKTESKNILTKSGYDLMPYTTDFYPEDFEKMLFYVEVYNTEKVLEKDEPFLIDYFIESYESKQIVGNYRSFKRETPKTVNALLTSFDIQKLPSGNYNLVVEIKNKENKTLTLKKVFFQRSNPVANEILVSNDYINSFVTTISPTELEDYIKSTSPISSQIELNFAKNQLSNKDTELMRQFFYNFWLTRNATNPEEEWKKYKELVKIAEQDFSTSIKKGYETDRGRIFLKHGKPNTLTEMKNETSTYPYEIWHYYGIEGRSNVKFIFYSPDIISNDYPLLHSTLPGEIFNAQWKVELHKRTNQPRDINETQPREYMHDRTDEFFALPR
jgi:GWxTD domain-containing protein